MSWKKGLKNVFFEDDDSQPVNSQTVQKPAVAVQPIAVLRSATPSYAYVATTSADPVFVERIKGVAEQAPQQSFKEFLIFLNALAVAIPDERSRYIAAVASASAKGFPAEEIIRGIDVVVKTIDAHVAQVRNSIPGQVEKIVGPKRSELSSMEQQIQQKQNQIAQLNTEISQLSSKRQTISVEVSSEEQRINETGEKISSAADVVRSQYTNERQRIINYSGIAVSANPTS